MPDIREEVRAALAAYDQRGTGVAGFRFKARVTWDQIRSLLAALDDAEQNAAAWELTAAGRQGDVERLAEDSEQLRAEIERLTRENKILVARCEGTLANNLCPDHRDKQGGKSCLACKVERLKAENERLRAEVERLKADLRTVIAADLDSRQRCSDYIVEIERLKAANAINLDDLARVADIAGEALGTHPDYRTPMGCVRALAESFHGTRPRPRSDDERRAAFEKMSESASVRRVNVT